MEYKNIILRTEVIINKKNNIVLELDSVTTTKVVRDTWSVPSEIRHVKKKNVGFNNLNFLKAAISKTYCANLCRLLLLNLKVKTSYI